MSKSCARLLIDNLKADSGKADEKFQDNVLFVIDNKGNIDDETEEDEKVKEAMSAVFKVAAHTMQSSEEGVQKKRKEERGAGMKKQVKFQRYDLFDHSSLSGDKGSFLDKDSSSGSEVENPLSDDDL